MRNRRNERMASLLLRLGAEFVEKTSTGKSLLTVTDIKISEDLKYATIYFTTFPETFENEALEFLKRKRAEFRDFVKKDWKMNPLPFFDFEIDKGEKHRQKIDSLLGH